MSFSPQRIKGSSTPERGVAKGLRSGASPSRWRSVRSKWRALGVVAVLLGTLSLAAPVATADPVTPLTARPVSLTAAGTIVAPATNDADGAYEGFEAEQIASGYNSCAISGGSLYCWGGNWAGQMGDGGTDYLLEATKVPSTQEFANANVTQVAFGEDHVCAVENGAVFCWGSNGYGELGNATTTNSNRPEKVVDVAGVFTNSGVTAISADRFHTCAVASGSVFCWGLNDYGQLGIGSFVSSSVPAKVADVAGVFTNTDVSAVSAGHRHGCAVASGSVFCWGDNAGGKLGNGSTSQSSVSVEVANVANGFTNTDVTAVSAGYAHTCAIASGSVYCWGSDSRGELGNGPDTGDTVVPGLVLNGDEGFTNVEVSMLSLGWDHSCALKGSEMYCWGSNEVAQLGINSSSNQQLPVKVVSVTDGFTNSSVTSIAAGYVPHLCNRRWCGVLLGAQLGWPTRESDDGQHSWLRVARQRVLQSGSRIDRWQRWFKRYGQYSYPRPRGNSRASRRWRFGSWSQRCREECRRWSRKLMRSDCVVSQVPVV
jgi:alpha-tubulin suppressor-like RCC1 family protein